MSYTGWREVRTCRRGSQAIHLHTPSRENVIDLYASSFLDTCGVKSQYIVHNIECRVGTIRRRTLCVSVKKKREVFCRSLAPNYKAKNFANS